MAKKHLLWQLFPTYLFITLAVLIAAGWYASRSFRTFYLNQITEDLEARAYLAREIILPVLEEQDINQVDELCKKLGRQSSMRITVVSNTGIVLGDSDEEPLDMKNHANREEIIQAIDEGLGQSIRPSPTLGIDMKYVAIRLKDDIDIGVIRTSLPISGINRALDDIYTKIFLGVLAIALGAALISLYVSSRITKPVIEMERIAHNYAEGNFEHRLPPYSAELGALAESLNQMARQLDERIKAITRQRNELEAILASMVEGVIAVDSKRHVVSVNRAASELLDIDLESSNGHNIEEVIRDVDLLDFVRKTLNSDTPVEAEMIFQKGDERFFQLHGASLSDSKGKRSGAVIVLTDMTRMRRLENIRRDFVSNVSHELRTPVTSIQGFVEALREIKIKDPDQVQRYLNIIAKHSERLNAIIEDLLSLSRLEQEGERREISFEKVSLKPVLAAAIELSDTKAKEKQIEINLACDNDIQVKVNSVLLEQAVLNLIDNAIKYSPERSIISVSVLINNGKITISVKDKGPGIDEKHLARIFERFYVVDKGRSRKLGGTGLGLAIVKHIAQVHGGFVNVKSSVGEGSAFMINLPGK